MISRKGSMPFPVWEKASFLESKGDTILRTWDKDVRRDVEGEIRAIIHAMETQY
jgi:very-short-patch-repair endonuclease